MDPFDYRIIILNLKWPENEIYKISELKNLIIAIRKLFK